MNDLTNYLEYAKQQHSNAYVVNQTPGDAARNIAMEFMSAGELVKFSMECIACAIRKIRHNAIGEARADNATPTPAATL